MRRLVVALGVALGGVAPATGQTIGQATGQASLPEAISSNLSPQDVAKAFEDAVVEVCAPAVIGGHGLAVLSPAARARVFPLIEPDARRQVGAEAADGVWEVSAARGVVRIHEHGGRCVVTAYGPPAAATLVQVARRLAASGQGFERLVATPGRGAAESLVRKKDGSRVQVRLAGSEPGMAGNKSRFSVLTATIFAGAG
jgi:hypothetical protein